MDSCILLDNKVINGEVNIYSDTGRDAWIRSNSEGWSRYVLSYMFTSSIFVMFTLKSLCH